MNTFKRGLFLSLLFILAIVLVACSEDGKETKNDEEKAPVSTEGSKVEELTIGYTGPLSGPAAFYGEETLKGLRMAAEEINDSGGFEVDGQKYTINLSTLDDKYLPNEAAANAKRLVQEQDTKFIYTPHSGGVYAMQVFNEMEDFIVMAYTSEPGVTETGNKMTVRIPPRYDRYIEPFTKYEMERFGKKIAFLPTATQYGKDWADSLRPVWEANGGEVVFDESIDFSKDTDFQTIMTNALAKNPDVLFIGGPSQPTALVLKQARDLGFEGGFIIMDQAKLDEIAAVLGGSYDLLEGVISTPPLVTSRYGGTEAFIEKYRSENDKDPGSESGFHYISLYILVEAMKAAGTVDDTEKIMAAMDQGAKNLPEDKEVYYIQGVDDDGGFLPLLRMAYVENGEIVQMGEEK
ncbi:MULTISPECIES: ABC transporter substrate-binding protein [Solibacillus]|uniref:ABC transporter substrate-binding protein n=1 Tax=Solibacillus merdavium TaxID=2762218 RepID=A0ABR8XMD4_9BACL|nr:ABC transporter substrate-binding protein [Solibacillus merdavium]MBD8033088.1 ABC transporter substrate-binding protein [Solibacillus merdavium]